MTTARFGRLRRRSWQEVRWRTREVLHTAGERVHAHVDGGWRRDDLGRILSKPARAACDDALGRKDWPAVQRALEACMLGRPARFVLDPSSAPAVRQRILEAWPRASQDAVRRAERVLDGTYDLLGCPDVRCAPNGRIDWHADPVHGRRAPRRFYADIPFLDPRIGDHKIIWELNRHQHWLHLGRAAWLTGDVRYARAICTQLDDWLASNPPFVGINWSSMLEIGFRSLSWTWALHCLLGIRDGTDVWLIDMLVALDRQLTHVERHLSYYFSPNTHLTGEALALYVVGTALPELAGAGRWADTGRRILLDEIDRQILSDGGHAERSTHYQRYTLDFYLLATLTARLADDPVTAQRFADAAYRLAEFTRTMADADGRLPLIGDDDGGMLWPLTGRACNDVCDSLALAASILGAPEFAAWGTTEEVVWLGGPDVVTLETPGTLPASRLLPDAGYFVARADDGSHAVLDAGAHGYQNAGHAHADALSLTLAIEGRPLLIDPGTSTYTMDAARRDRMRSTASHNTVTIDDRSQSVPAGPFHWRSTVDARVVAWRHNPSFDWIEAVHDGYAPLRHRRMFVRTRRSGWLVVDVVLGGGRHAAAAHWHFDPAWHVLDTNGRLCATHADGSRAWMLCAGGETRLFHGDSEHGLGWCAPVYGQLRPTFAARLASKADTPFALVTWIGGERRFASPTLRWQPPDGASDSHLVVEIVDGSRTAVFMVRASDAAGRACRAGEFETDAAMLHYVRENNRLMSLSIVGGRHCLSSRTEWPSIAADSPIRDLHIDLRQTRMDFESAEPPSGLTVYRTAGCGRVRVNGRDLPLSAKATTDILLINESDWPPFSGGNAATNAAGDYGAAFARH